MVDIISINESSTPHKGSRHFICENQLVYPKPKSKTLLTQGFAFFDLVN